MDNLKNNSFINTQVNYLSAKCTTLSNTISVLEGTISDLDNRLTTSACDAHTTSKTIRELNTLHDEQCNIINTLKSQGIAQRTTISELQGKAQHTDRLIVDYKQRIVKLEEDVHRDAMTIEGLWGELTNSEPIDGCPVCGS